MTPCCWSLRRARRFRTAGADWSFGVGFGGHFRIFGLIICRKDDIPVGLPAGRCDFGQPECEFRRARSLSVQVLWIADGTRDVEVSYLIGRVPDPASAQAIAARARSDTRVKEGSPRVRWSRRQFFAGSCVFDLQLVVLLGAMNKQRAAVADEEADGVHVYVRA